MKWDELWSTRGRVLGIVAAVSILVSLMQLGVGGIPEPRVHDEFSYLLAGETFALGRVTNPQPGFWEHFETYHELVRPTYMSKYPPGQGLFLALGIVLTNAAIVGVWISTCLACVAVAWAMLGWMENRWALLAGIVASMHPIVLGWNHSYWGGSVAMLGGALVVGSGVRMLRSSGEGKAGFFEPSRNEEGNSILNGVWFGVGVIVLINSRPFEGVMLSGLMVAWVIWNRLNDSTVGKSLGITGLLVMLGMGWTLYDNWRVTGKPLTMPYMEHAKQYSMTPVWWFMGPKEKPVYRHAVIEAHYATTEVPIYEHQRSVSGWLDQLGWKIGSLGRAFYVSWHDSAVPAWINWPRVLLAAALVGIPIAIARDQRTRGLTIVLTLFAIGMALAVWFYPHYAAPAGVVWIGLHVAGLAAIERVNPKAGRVLLVLFCVGLVAGVASQVWRMSHGTPLPVQKQRSELLAFLEDKPEKWLVLVNEPIDNPAEFSWVFNGPDLVNAKVLLARDMGAEKNRAIVEWAKSNGRKVGLVTVLPDRSTWQEP